MLVNCYNKDHLGSKDGDPCGFLRTLHAQCSLQTPSSSFPEVFVAQDRAQGDQAKARFIVCRLSNLGSPM